MVSCTCICSLSLFVSLSPGLAVLQRILDTAAERGWQVTSVNLDVVTEVAFVKLLSDLDYKREFQIIIDCELERLNYILNLVKKYRCRYNFTPRKDLVLPHFACCQCRVITGTNSVQQQQQLRGRS